MSKNICRRKAAKARREHRLDEYVAERRAKNVARKLRLVFAVIDAA